MPSFSEIARFDGRNKVLGKTQYGADFHLPSMLHAMLVPATIAKGKLIALDISPALQIPGVVRVLTGKDAPSLKPDIAYLGQTVALVVAETLEAAIEGAEALRPEFETTSFAPLMTSPGAQREAADGLDVGNAEDALASAAIVIEGRFETPAQHHNPIELLGTVAAWSGETLTIYEGCQNSERVKAALAEALQMAPNLIVIKSESVGGGFGQKSPPKPQTILVVLAAKLTGRPVKLVTPRGQSFHISPHRPRSIHNLRLAADDNGRMTGILHDVEHENVIGGMFRASGYHEDLARLYSIENFKATATEVYIDRNLTRQTRGTHPFPACFALESAIDELAYLTGKDPVQLRLEHEATRDIIEGKPLAPHQLNECLREGARRFEWNRRRPEPGSMRLDDGTLVGLGVACGVFGASGAAAETTLRVRADGSSKVMGSGHEMGQGISSAIANTLAQTLDINLDRLEIVLGDTSAGPQAATVGEGGTSRIVPVMAKAAQAMRERFAELAGPNPPAGNLHQQLARLKRPYLEVTVSELAPGQDQSALDEFRKAGGGQARGFPDFSSFSYIAQFVEIHIEPRTGRIRMPRAVSIADIGRVVSPRTAKSQMYGGVVWGFSTALREESEVDPRFAGYLNDDLADYVLAVNADIGSVDVGFVDVPDPMINSVGVKGMGELVMVGTAPAIANAIYHATGKRIRKLPIRIEDLL
ncbi:MULTISPECIES: xanthine dehydrogenase family protein molybdopterin-binding subunit [Rhizobium]|uniref:xanthine dehydrogenase family protein molybdopterin-binding subunit n=1 Tax=Rhizobium TaxID=379 RepID=UPI001C830AB6|nr:MULTISPECIES: xanthine dehydrogenase family protein molybdopterin-binding subunit [Rhizobium]MBX4899620.1 xanthine dehydrogenase family protein molybdopterin-binding subunit [Rhizobium bangladeshense]MBX5297522.1 xanthine dehydrogenase family protein molybdopterin-binding subunit [Rhizobium sp. NLR15a]MBY3617792.1 xanthine dehydrogenase family protein molybdopterin-binding subunit [Rhizobium bangladeshense]